MDETKTAHDVGPLSGKEPTDWQGPRRRAPAYYAGEHVGKYRMQYPDVVRHRNGTLPGLRNKLARRLIRKVFKARAVKSVRSPRVNEGLVRVREMRRQARDLASDRTTKIEDHHNGNRSARFASTSGDTRWAQRLFEKELAIHQPVYCPDKKTIRAMRTQKRKDKRAGKLDAIGQLVDRMKK